MNPIVFPNNPTDYTSLVWTDAYGAGWLFNVAKNRWGRAVELPAGTVVSETAPVITKDGQGWFKASTGELFISASNVWEHAGGGAPASHAASHAANGSDPVSPASIGALPANDPSVTNARTPTHHAASHAANGADPLSPADIGAATAAQGALADTSIQPGDPALTDARTPLDHAASHATDGSDPITPASIGSHRFFVQDTAPASSDPGDEWFNSANGQTYTRYDGFWVGSAPAVVAWSNITGKPAYFPTQTYDRRYDRVASTLYFGKAVTGTLDSGVWALTRQILNADGTTASLGHATDSWTNHATATYI